MEPAARTANGDEETTRRRDALTDLTKLQAAVVRGDVDAMTQLLDGGAIVDQDRGDGATPLWIACEKGHVDAARLLLERGAALKVDSSALCEGDKIEADYRGRGRLYPAKISRACGNGKCDIAYDDGEEETAVEARLIRKKNDIVYFNSVCSWPLRRGDLTFGLRRRCRLRPTCRVPKRPRRRGSAVAGPRCGDRAGEGGRCNAAVGRVCERPR